MFACDVFMLTLETKIIRVSSRMLASATTLDANKIRLGFLLDVVR